MAEAFFDSAARTHSSQAGGGEGAGADFLRGTELLRGERLEAVFLVLTLGLGNLLLCRIVLQSRGMRRIPAMFLVGLLAGVRALSQDVGQAEAELERVRGLVEAGALPRKALSDAETGLAEARDNAVLRETLYGQVGVESLTEEESRRMTEAAERQLERQRARVEQTRKMVEEGVLARTALTPYLEEMDRRRRIHDEAASRARLFQELAAIVKAELELEVKMEESPQMLNPQLAERFDGNGVFLNSDFRMVVLAYEQEFGKAMPISARGETALHRAMGYDHRGRVDVALYPDSREGAWLRRHLESQRIPYYAFRGFVPGRATAAHIHIGPPSLRIRKSD
jgi:hypothetical protein